MKFELNGDTVYASTGGRDHVQGQPWLILMHGSGASHLVWSQQSRSFAYGGYNVLAIDFPGHNLSGGKVLESVEDQAEWMIRIMDHLEIKSATIVGHSQGGLVALSMADKAADRIDKIVFVATAAAIPVHEMLISSAQNKQYRAKSSMTSWGLGPDAHHFENSVPGFSNVGMGLRTMDLNETPALPADLIACNTFEGGIEIAKQVKCPTLCVLAAKDKMTPLKFGKKLAEALPNNTLHVMPNSGHTIPSERPIELNALMREFLDQ